MKLFVPSAVAVAAASAASPCPPAFTAAMRACQTSTKIQDATTFAVVLLDKPGFHKFCSTTNPWPGCRSLHDMAPRLDCTYKVTANWSINPAKDLSCASITEIPEPATTEPVVPTTVTPTTTVAPQTTTSVPATTAPIATTTAAPTTAAPTTAAPTTATPTTTVAPQTTAPVPATTAPIATTSAAPTTAAPTTAVPTTGPSTTVVPQTTAPVPTTTAPIATTTAAPTTVAPTAEPTTEGPAYPTEAPATTGPVPTTTAPIATTTAAPTSAAPTAEPTTEGPAYPTEAPATTAPVPTTTSPIATTTTAPTTAAPTASPTTEGPAYPTESPATTAPVPTTTAPPTTEGPAYPTPTTTTGAPSAASSLCAPNGLVLSESNGHIQANRVVGNANEGLRYDAATRTIAVSSNHECFAAADAATLVTAPCDASDASQHWRVANHKVQHASLGVCLQVDLASAGARVALAPCTSVSETNQWFDACDQVPTNVVQLVSESTRKHLLEFYSSLFVDAGGHDFNDLFTWNGRMLKSLSSNECLDAYATEAGFKVHTYPCDDANTNQQWTIDTGRVKHAVHSNLCLDADPTDADHNVQVWDCTPDNRNQRWQLVPYSQH